ncbi:drug/metabolite transporter (DMT)-like permease [Mesorhizobium soli]|jgi:drug/metabolite transporter (DMT)-like permease|uniref:DMT family transporter n=1 Tax=Pseudaminobacter soli (ex Li et al. 2025) TaxID=1295366 RepID=UPI002475EAB7|nr:DMT family transporter [Mesorhizobium soli]MDH6232564.1 drug/metabolite transporter (DMT)-like permease [Mesorhizobium soli]
MTASQSLPKAAFWMGCSLACTLMMTAAGRETTRELGLFQIMEMRSVIGLLMLSPLVWRAGGLRAMKTAHPVQHLTRNIAHYAGQFAWLYGLTLIPLAQVIAIEFTAPIWTALLAMAFLGERMNAWKTGAILLGLIGVAVIVRPSGHGIELGQFVVLGAAMTFAVSYVLVKSMTRDDSAVKIIFWMLVIQSVIGLIPALHSWQWPSAHAWPWIVALAFAGSFSHYCTARAMSHADATAVMPMDFLRVPLTALLGYLAYSERIDAFTALGAMLILSGNLLNLGSRRVRSAAPA